MKLSKFGGIVLGTVVAGIGAVLLTTNPDRQDYEQYATRALTTYLKEGACDKARSSPEIQALLRGYCKLLVDTGNPFLRQVISAGTTRQNFLIFSVYQTELSFPAPVPGYQFSTIAVGRKFFTYEALEI